MPRILHIINGLPIGGSETLLVNHVARLARDYPELESRVLVLGRRHNANEAYIERLPVKPIFLESNGRYRDPISSARCIAGIRRAIGAFGPDIVHSYLWLADVFTALAIRGTRIRHVSHVLDRRSDRNAAKAFTRWRTRLTGRLLRASKTKFVAVSDACRAHAMRQFLIAPDAIVTAHNGIDPEMFVPTTQDLSRAPTIFGTISRIAEEKGHICLLEAFGQLSNSSIRLQIAGSGKCLEQVRALAAEKGLGDRVKFLGHVSSAAAFYRQIDALVVPSIDNEGLPTTILEAMASGRPVIATDVGGAREVIENGRQGILVPPRDIAALAKAISNLADSPGEARVMGQAGRLRVMRQFTVESMTRRIVQEVYASAFAPVSLQAQAA